jgi:hypothetical protein
MPGPVTRRLPNERLRRNRMPALVAGIDGFHGLSRVKTSMADTQGVNDAVRDNLSPAPV